MNPVHRIADLPALLELPGVVEELELGSALGVCALHGGGLERATEVVTQAERGHAGGQRCRFATAGASCEVCGNLH